MWLGGRVARWPGGRVARWPGGWVASWQGGWGRKQKGGLKQQFIFILKRMSKMIFDCKLMICSVFPSIHPNCPCNVPQTSPQHS